MTVDANGLRRRKYETYQTPHERLKLFLKTLNPEEVKKCLRKGVSLKMLDAIADEETDNDSARAMQKAKNKLFRTFGERGRAMIESLRAEG